MWSNYYNVTTIAEVLELLDQYKQYARIIAGGTDILIEIEQGKRVGVDTLIDISRIPNLDTIRLHGDTITLGALVNHNHVVDSQIIRERALPLAQASWEVGAPQIRNRATVVGNLITASSANDTITPLMALDAEVTLSSMRGERNIRLSEFYMGLRQTIMQPDEILTSVSFPALASNERGIFLKLGLRRAQAISVVNVAIVLTFEDETVSAARITMGSVAPTIIRSQVAEQALVGRKLTPDAISEVARLAGQTPSPINDVRSTAEYRSEMVKVLVARALRALGQGTHDNLPDNPAMLWDTRATMKQDDISSENSAIEPITANVNGNVINVNTGQTKTLLHWLRDDVGLKGTKEGCAEGECGACTVFLDGSAVMSCMVAAPRAHGATITTVEGLRDTETIHPVQDAFVQQDAVQCGYCTPGFVMSGAKLLQEHPQPTDEQIKQSISGNLCRCTGYYNIIQAIKTASEKQKE